MSNKNNEIMLQKVVLLGTGAIGKSNLILRYFDDIYDGSHTSTIGIDFRVKTIKVEGKMVKL